MAGASPAPPPAAAAGAAGAAAAAGDGGGAIPLLSAFYSVFDNRLGPVIGVQEPKAFLSAQQFDTISDYMITGEGLCGQLITVRAFGYQVMAWPFRLVAGKYHRNAFSFSVGFVFDDAAETDIFGPVLAKLGRALATLEAEDEFLSRGENGERLAAMVADLFRSLRERQQWTCSVNEANHIRLCLFPRMPEAPPVRGHHVPILFRDLAQFPKMALSWDPTINLVARYIDGIMHVKRIAAAARVDLRLACNAVRQLVHFGLAATIDVFQFGNIYVPTPRIGEFMRRRRMQRECVEYVATAAPEAAGADLQPAEIFRLYCSFKRGVKVRALCLSNRLLRDGLVGPRRLVAFGVLNGLIRRVHQYPVPRGGSRFRPTVESSVAREMMDGTRSFDEICSELGVSSTQLEWQVRQDPNLVIMFK